MKIPLKFRALLWWVNHTFQTPIYEMSIDQARSRARAASDRSEAFVDYKPIRLYDVCDELIDTRNGKTKIRIYRPTKQKQLPCIVFFHGGGFVLRSIDTHDRLCRRIARDNGVLVVSVNYRLAPEHKYPTGLYDCYDATCWVYENAKLIGCRPDRLLVMGDSAGANLASAVCMLVRDLAGPPIYQQVLVYPCTDGTLRQPSMDYNGEGYLLTKPIIQWFLNQYKRSEADVQEPYFSLLLAEDLRNLPPAIVLTAQYDPLLDDGRAYAQRLRAAGNEVVYKEYKGMIHGFFGMPRMSKIVLHAHRDVQQYLKPLLF